MNTWRMKPQPGDEERAEEFRRRQAMIDQIKEQFPGIDNAEASRLLEALEARRKGEARKQYEEAMGKLAPPPHPLAPIDPERLTDMRGQPVLKEPPSNPPPMPVLKQGRAQGRVAARKGGPNTPPPEQRGIRSPFPVFDTAVDPGRAQPIQPQPQGTAHYGQRIGSNASSHSMDFIDEDGDGVDDRYQRGPGQRNEGPAAGRKTTPRHAPSLRHG